jgi:mannose-6-phosphate isomerase-like protein (cupin superfamily)
MNKGTVMAQNTTKKSAVITQDSHNPGVNPQISHPLESDEYYFHEGCYILEILNCVDDPALSIARARVEPGKTTRMHSLKGVSERYLIQQGCARVTVGDLEEDLTVGSVVVIPEGVRQCIHNSGTEDLVFLALCTPRFEPSCYQDLE